MKDIDKYFLLIIIFIILNILPVARFGFDIHLFVGYIIRLSIAFLIIIYFHVKFLDYFENLVFILAFISIPLYLIQIIYPGIFNIFNSFSNLVLIDEHISTNSKYLLVYFYNGRADYSNSGFMGEPSRYAILLAWGLLIHFYKNGFKFDDKCIVYLLAFITGFSTGGFIYLILLLLLFLYFNNTKRAYINILKLTTFITLFIYFGLQLQIVQQQTETIKNDILIREPDNYKRVRAGTVQSHQVGRVSGAIVNLKYFIKWPLGYGINRSNISGYLYLGNSPNALSMLIVTWGIGFLVFLFLASKIMIKILKVHNNKLRNRSINFSFFNFGDLLTLLVIVIPLSGHSVGHDPFTFAFLIWPYVVYPYFFKNRTRA